jgi:hypothetical protein
MMVPSTWRSFLGLRDRTAEAIDQLTDAALFLHGRGEFLFDVSGAGRHQAALRDIVSARTLARQRQACMAALLLDDGNSGDRGAVAVRIEGRLVGHLPGYLATQYREWLRNWRLAGSDVRCRGVIINWNGGEGSVARYNAKLDLELPFKMTTV